MKKMFSDYRVMILYKSISCLKIEKFLKQNLTYKKMHFEEKSLNLINFKIYIKTSEIRILKLKNVILI